MLECDLDSAFFSAASQDVAVAHSGGEGGMFAKFDLLYSCIYDVGLGDTGDGGGAVGGGDATANEAASRIAAYYCSGGAAAAAVGLWPWLLTAALAATSAVRSSAAFAPM